MFKLLLYAKHDQWLSEIVDFFLFSVEQNSRDTQMTTRVTEGASRPRFSRLARACTPPTKSEDTERLLAVYKCVVNLNAKFTVVNGPA